MPVTRSMAASLAIVTLAAPMTLAQQADDIVADPERGKIVYRSVAYCGNCHGWPGDGITGILLQAPRGANLRESKLDTQALIEVIKCGLPGTEMPYHSTTAYRDGSCYGMEMSDFAPGNKPIRGKTFRDKDIVNLVAYLQTKMIGLGKPTVEECADFFDNPAASACGRFK
jgi:mono/diheme cytochrome c family protein